jgi:hypothetical protein
MIASLFQISAFITYISYVMSQQGAAPSISESWDRLEEREKPLFTIFCWSIGLPMFFQSTDQTHFFFLAGIGMILVGGTSYLRGSFRDCVHRAGAAAGILGSLLGLWFDSGCWWPLLGLIAAFLFVTFWKRIENKIWWIEIAAFTFISLGLLWR